MSNLHLTAMVALVCVFTVVPMATAQPAGKCGTGVPQQDPLLLALIEFAPELQPIVGQSAHGFDRRSTEIGLSYAGTPHPAMGVDVIKGAQPGDYEDLLVTMPGSPARLYRCRAITMKGVPYFEDVTLTVFGANPPYELHGASDADFDTDAVLGPASRAPARTDP